MFVAASQHHTIFIMECTGAVRFMCIVRYLAARPLLGQQTIDLRCTRSIAILNGKCHPLGIHETLTHTVGHVERSLCLLIGANGETS